MWLLQQLQQQQQEIANREFKTRLLQVLQCPIADFDKVATSNDTDELDDDSDIESRSASSVRTADTDSDIFHHEDDGGDGFDFSDSDDDDYRASPDRFDSQYDQDDEGDDDANEHNYGDADDVDFGLPSNRRFSSAALAYFASRVPLDQVNTVLHYDDDGDNDPPTKRPTSSIKFDIPEIRIEPSVEEPPKAPDTRAQIPINTEQAQAQTQAQKQAPTAIASPKELDDNDDNWDEDSSEWSDTNADHSLGDWNERFQTIMAQISTFNPNTSVAEEIATNLALIGLAQVVPASNVIYS
jgi:hypothetical protein